MRFTEIALQGAFIIEPDLIEDDRGFFARIFCRREFEGQALNTDFVQQNISFNRSKGTIRGMHYRVRPHAEAKIVRCTRGAAYDVIVDLRAKSPTFMKWAAIDLTAENHRSIYIPDGFSHGFMTLTDETELTYLHSSFYEASAERGIRFDDPSLAIAWPARPRVISDRDSNFPYIDHTFQGIEP